MDFARWDRQVTVTDAAIPATAWPGKRRMKQYRGGHRETWGGVTINIDNDYVDFAPLPPARSADFTGNGWSDVLVRSSSGTLSAMPGNGGFVDNGARRTIGGGSGLRRPPAPVDEDTNEASPEPGLASMRFPRLLRECRRPAGCAAW